MEEWINDLENYNWSALSDSCTSKDKEVESLFQNVDIKENVINSQEPNNRIETYAESTSTSNVMVQGLDQLHVEDIGEMPQCSSAESKIELKDPPDIEQILNADENSIEATSQNVSILNAACQNVLRKMEQVLLNRLKQNRKEQEIIMSYLNSKGKVKSFEPVKQPNLRVLGIPYFKDSDGFPPPRNEDVCHKMKYLNHTPYDILNGSHQWYHKDSKLLVQAVMNSVGANSLKDSIDPKTVDWMKISATDLNGKYSPAECKSMWLLNLCPSVNKSPWSEKEIRELKAIANKHKYQNWDKIAEELNTGRTGFQCCVWWQTHKPAGGERWTKEEDNALLHEIKKHKIKEYIPWRKVAANFNGRSLRQCYERYIYHLINIKKGSFSTQEDYVLLFLYSKLKNFKEVAKYFPKRVAPQIRSRYEYLVTSTMAQFTKEEDDLLMQLMVKYPRNWEKISAHFKNRSKLQCRARWATLQKTIPFNNEVDSESEPEVDNAADQGKTNDNVNNDNLDAKLIGKKIIKASMKIYRRPTMHDFSEQYRRLLEYCKGGYKFLYGPKPRCPSSSVEKDLLCDKMEIAMKNLFVKNFQLLENFNVDSLKQNCEFSVEDLIVLETLKASLEANKETGTENDIFKTSNSLFPPNFITLLGLRTLILSLENIKNLVSHYKSPPVSAQRENNSENLILFSDAKKLFKARLKALFAFPLIMSNITQAGIEVMYVPPKKVKRVRPLSKRARKKHARKIQAFHKKIQSALDKNFGRSENQANSKQNEKGGVILEKSLKPEKRKKGRPRKNPPRNDQQGDEEESVSHAKKPKLEPS